MAVSVPLQLMIPRALDREIMALVRTRYVTRSEAARRLLIRGLEAERQEFGPVELEPEPGPIRLKGVL